MLNRLAEKSALSFTSSVSAFLEKVKSRHQRLAGFVPLPVYDKRVELLKSIASDVYELVDRPHIIDAAEELEKQVLADAFFNNVKPSITFYTSLIYKAMGFPPDMMPVLAAIPQCAGFLAHWVEAQQTREPWPAKSLYNGRAQRQYVSVDDRDELSSSRVMSKSSESSLRRTASSANLLQ
jgi:citrate synthase